MRLRNLEGMKFGMLLVACRSDNKGIHAAWECLCECGNTKTVSSTNLLTGNTKSCGCIRSAKGDKHHNWKEKVSGYRNDHANIGVGHRSVVEKILGYAIPRGAVVHHIDNMKSNNNPQNLVLCQSSAYHNMIHRRAVAYYTCEHADWRKCSFCGKYDSAENLYSNERQSWHRTCKSEYSRKHRANKAVIYG